MSDLLDEFFSNVLYSPPIKEPVSVNWDGDFPVVIIHDPTHPDACATIAAMLAGFNAYTRGLDHVTVEMVKTAMIEARQLLDAAIAQLDSGTDQVGILVEYVTGDEEPHEPA